MTPTLTDILSGNARVIAGLAANEGGLEFAGAQLSVVAMLSLLAAQEAERGAAVRIAENADIAALLADAMDTYPTSALLPLDVPASIAALDTLNADLRRRLIALHIAVEAAGDSKRDRAILALYGRMARGRRLIFPAF